MSFYLAIVSPLDAPLYEISFTSSKPSSSSSAASATPAGSSFPSWSSFTSSSTATTEPDTNGTKLGGQLGLIPPGTPALERHLAQMVAFAALDSVDEVIESTGSLYLKNIDRHNHWIVSAFIATSVKFVLLHDQKNDDGIRLFFLDLWELYVKTSLNPFHTPNTPIRSPAFDAKVKTCAKRNL